MVKNWAKVLCIKAGEMSLPVLGIQPSFPCQLAVSIPSYSHNLLLMYSFGLLVALPVCSALSTDFLLKRAQPICGGYGYDLSTNAYFGQTGSLATIKACGAHCLADSSCASFAVGDNTCLHYTVPVTGNFNPNSESPYAFYDRSCATSSASSSSLAHSSVSTRSVSASPSRSASSSLRSSTVSTHALLSSSSLVQSSTSSAHVTSSSSLVLSSTLSTITSASSSLSRSSTASSSVPSALSCGLVGYDKNSPESFTDSTSAAYHTLSGCVGLCKATSGCQSIALSSSICYLYKTPVAGNFKEDASSPYKFYDLACSGATSSSIVFSSTSSSTMPSSSSSSFVSTSTSSSTIPSSSSPSYVSSSTSSSTDPSSLSPSTTSSTTSSISTSPTCSFIDVYHGAGECTISYAAADVVFFAGPAPSLSACQAYCTTAPCFVYWISESALCEAAAKAFETGDIFCTDTVSDLQVYNLTCSGGESSSVSSTITSSATSSSTSVALSSSSTVSDSSSSATSSSPSTMSSGLSSSTTSAPSSSATV
ncbi:hypothetical protein BT63DRAFT_181504 [Microthyrium microscopicum]|uniref:Apple domain-containing protein n=1 Tax=Microthyrium microscopicum TaxID=703497 RepID=A0A6A6UHV0_9PEZI|nr:hypothetical protein BT63DRAFT_181504 [Microthyrium microscopicum]